MLRRSVVPRVLAALAIVLAMAPISEVRAATSVSQDNWTLAYDGTDGRGIGIDDAYFNGHEVFARSTLAFVDVSYEDPIGCCTDYLGYSVRKSGPTKTNITTGFSLSSTYCFGSCRPYDTEDNFAYKYVEKYYFYETGKWAAQLYIYGPGRRPEAEYDPYWRVDYDITDGENDHFERYAVSSWTEPTTENQFCDDGNNANGTLGDYEWAQEDRSPQRRYAIDPLGPQFYCVTALRFHTGEYGGTVGVLNPPPSAPGSYDNNESLPGSDIVLWYRGVRSFIRPSSCSVSGEGCTSATVISFYAIPSDY